MIELHITELCIDSEPVSCSHVEPGTHALLPIGMVAVEVCARLCAWLFQHPRLEHGFFMRTTDFLQVTDEMSIETPPCEVICSAVSGFDRDDSASQHAQPCGLNEKRDDPHNLRSARYVRTKRSRYHQLNQRLRHAAWRSSLARGDTIGQSGRRSGVIVEVATLQSDPASGCERKCAAMGCSARWEGTGDDDLSGRVRLLLWQELISQLAHCFGSFLSAGARADTE